MTTYESLSMNTPVVTADVGGQKELVGNDCGRVIKCYQNKETDLCNFDYSKQEIDDYVEYVLGNLYDLLVIYSYDRFVRNVKDNLKQNVYKTIIPRNVRLAEAPSHGLPINKYDPKSAGAEGYRSLAQEVIDRKF